MQPGGLEQFGDVAGIDRVARLRAPVLAGESEMGTTR
jgi:hypothetical protein